MVSATAMPGIAPTRKTWLRKSSCERTEGSRDLGALALVLSSVLAMVSGSTAQNRDRNPRPNREPNRQPNRQEVEGMMEAYILSKLQDSLDLTDEQFGSMVVAQTKLSDTRRAYRRDRMQVLRQMRQTLKREQAGESELQPLLSQLRTLGTTSLATRKPATRPLTPSSTSASERATASSRLSSRGGSAK